MTILPVRSSSPSSCWAAGISFDFSSISIWAMVSVVSAAKALRNCLEAPSWKASKLLRRTFPSIASTRHRSGASGVAALRSAAWDRKAASTSAASSPLRIDRIEVCAGGLFQPSPNALSSRFRCTLMKVWMPRYESAPVTIARIANSRIYRCSKRLPSARRGSAIISSRVRIGSNAVTVTICSGLLQPILLIQTDPRWGTQNLPARPTKSVAATFRTHVRSAIRTSNPRELNDPGLLSMSCGISSPKQLFRVVTNAEGTLAPYRAPDPRGGRAPFRNHCIPASQQTGGEIKELDRQHEAISVASPC